MRHQSRLLSLSLCVFCRSQIQVTIDCPISHTDTPRYNATTTNEMEARDKKMIDWMMVMNGIDDWIGLDWIGLDWIGLMIGLDWIGLDWIGLD